LVAIKQAIPKPISTAWDLVEAIYRSHQGLSQERKLASAEEALQRQIDQQIAQSLELLSRPELSPETIDIAVAPLVRLRNQKWMPALFEDVLSHSNHWHKVLENPTYYGQIRTNSQQLLPGTLPVLLDAEAGTVLEMAPAALHTVLGGQSTGVPPARVVAAREGFWAFPQGLYDNASSPDKTSWLRRPLPRRGSGHAEPRTLSEFEHVANLGTPDGVDALFRRLNMNESLGTCKMIDYAIGLVATEDGRSQIKHYLFNGTQMQRNYAALYFRRRGDRSLLNEALARDLIDKPQTI
jgi:hypothetical protein